MHRLVVWFHVMGSPVMTMIGMWNSHMGVDDSVRYSMSRLSVMGWQIRGNHLFVD